MKILGILGVCLWLGSLLASAGAVEKTRVHLALVEEWTEQTRVTAAEPVPGAEVADSDSENAPLDFSLLLSPAIFPARLVSEGVAYAGADLRTSRHVLTSWHLGQGPPADGIV